MERGSRILRELRDFENLGVPDLLWQQFIYRFPEVDRVVFLCLM